MKRALSPLALLGLAVALLCPALAGCGHLGTASTMSPDEEKHFKGGPMPPEAQRGFARMMQQAQQKAARQSAAMKR